jgi:hypothetical protein
MTVILLLLGAAAVLWLLSWLRADLTINAANVNGLISGNQYISGTSAQAFTAGQTLYQSSTTGLWAPAQSNSVQQNSGTTGACVALSSCPGGGQPFQGWKSGTIFTGNTAMVVGQTYVISANAGNIAPVSDLATGLYVTVLGVAISATQLQNTSGGIQATGVQHA